MLRYSGRPVASSKRVLLQSAPSSSQAIIASVDDVPCPISAAGERKEIELSACRRRKALDATVAGGASDDDETDAHAPSGIAIWSRTTEPATAPLRRRNSRRSSLCARVWPRFIERPPSSCGSGFDRRASSAEHTSELQSLMRNSYPDYCSKKT